MANFQHLLESPIRWIVHWSDYRKPGSACAVLKRAAKGERIRRERLLRRNHLNG